MVLPVCLPVCASVHLSVCVSVHLSVCVSVHLSVCASVHLSVCASVHLFIYSSVHLSVCPSVALSGYACECHFVCVRGERDEVEAIFTNCSVEKIAGMKKFLVCAAAHA